MFWVFPAAAFRRLRGPRKVRSAFRDMPNGALRAPALGECRKKLYSYGDVPPASWAPRFQ
jgi:hypothetical protein